MLVAGFVVLDLLTPGKLGQLVMEGNKGAGLITATSLISLGLILYFAIYFTGAGWNGLDDAVVFGIVGVAVQAAGFVDPRHADPGQARQALLRAEPAPRRVGDVGDSAVGGADRLRLAHVSQPARVRGALAPFHRVHQLDHAVVARGRDAELASRVTRRRR